MANLTVKIFNVSCEFFANNVLCFVNGVLVDFPYICDVFVDFTSISYLYKSRFAVLNMRPPT